MISPRESLLKKCSDRESDTTYLGLAVQVCNVITLIPVISQINALPGKKTDNEKNGKSEKKLRMTYGNILKLKMAYGKNLRWHTVK